MKTERQRNRTEWTFEMAAAIKAVNSLSVTSPGMRSTIAVFLLLALPISMASAGTANWNVPTGGGWTTNNPERWLPANVPVAGDNVVFGDVAGQTTNYVVSVSDTNVKIQTYGTLTIGSGSGNNGYTKKLDLGRNNGLLKAAGGIINTDGILIIGGDVWAYLALPSGGSVTNFGALGGGGQWQNQTTPLSAVDGIYPVSGRANFVNRGTININVDDLTKAHGLKFIRMNFDNIGQAIVIKATETLHLNDTHIFGGTITNNGTLHFYKNAGGSTVNIGTAADPVTIVHKGGNLYIRPGGDDYFDLNVTGGNATISDGEALIVKEGQRIEVASTSLAVATVTGAMQVNGTLRLTNGASLNVQNVGLTVGAAGILDNTTGTIRLSGGNMTLNSTNHLAFDATSTEVIFGGTVQQLGPASADLGESLGGFIDNFALGTLTLAGTGTVTVAGTAGKALYVSELHFNGEQTLNIGNTNVYVRDTVVTPGGSYTEGKYGNGALGGLLLAGTGQLYIIAPPRGTCISVK